MKEFLEKQIARLWNRRGAKHPAPVHHGILEIGAQVVDGEPVGSCVSIAQNRRAEHVALVGKSGSGKTSLIRRFETQDIDSSRGFISWDLHGGETPFLLKTIAGLERATRRDLSSRVIVIDPADPEYSVGLNPLECQPGNDRFLHVAEISQILKERWHLEGFGPRTDELLRNCLFALSENGLTLVEVAPFLGESAFRARCLAAVSNPEIREYFESRFNQASDAMRRVLAEPVLNKISFFVTDPRFRHLLGQRQSTFSLAEAVDRGYWIILNLDRGRLGEQAATLGSLFLTKTKHAIFSRKAHGLFTLYCDEIQNLVAFGGGLETILAEARKKSCGVVTANQYLAQFPPEMQSAILSVGSFGFFQLSGADAQQIATMLDGGKSLAERLKNLPRQHLIAKTLHRPWQEAWVPTVREPEVDPSDLYRRSRDRWARRRSDIEHEIQSRRAVGRRNHREALDGWE